MLFRKKLISNFIWILAMIVLIVMGAQYAFLYGIDFLFAGEDNVFAGLVSGSYMALDIALLVWIVIFMGLVVGIYYSGRALSGLIRRKIKSKAHVANIICILMVCITFIAAILVRGYILLSSGTLILKDTKYFDAALGVLDGTGDISGFSSHGASYAYIMILYFVMTFLGGRAVAAILLQVIIQVLTIILVFSTYKCFVNYTCALTASLILAVSPLYTAKLLVADPGCFIALLAVSSMYLVSCLLRTDGGTFKTVLGAVLGVVAGYLLYLDVSVIVFLIPWLFAFIYEAVDKNRHGFLLAYVFMFCFTIIGFVASIVINGSMLFGDFGEAMQQWINVSAAGIIPEHALLDANAGFSGLLQCLIMVGIASMTIMGTVGREYIEYELPWVMMMAAALTPMTKWGYLQDNTLALVIYILLVGAGMSAMISARTRKVTIKVGGDDETEGTETQKAETGSPNVDLFTQAVDAAQKANEERLRSAADAHAEEDDGIIYEDLDDETEYGEESEYEDDTVDENELAFTDLNDEDIADEPPKSGKAQAPKVKPDQKRKVPEETPEEDLPTSISWASIKALDDDLPDLLEPEEEEDDEAPSDTGIEDSQETDTVFSSAGRDFDVVVPGFDFATEEAYEPEEEVVEEETEDNNEDETEEVYEDELEESEAEQNAPVSSDPSLHYTPEQEYDPETMQVDYMPGMIPNPLPLPPKKRHVEMSYDVEFDDEGDFEDLNAMGDPGDYDDASSGYGYGDTDYHVIPDNFGYKADNDPDFDDIDDAGAYQDPGFDDIGDMGVYQDPYALADYDDDNEFEQMTDPDGYDEFGEDGFDGYNDIDGSEDMDEEEFGDFDDNDGFDDYDDDF